MGNFQRILTEAVSTQDDLNLGPSKILSEAQPVADETIENKAIGKSLTETIIPSDTIQAGTFMEFAEMITPIDTISKSVVKTPMESVLISELFSPTGFKVISLFLSGIDRIDLVDKGTLLWTKILTRHGATAEFTISDKTQSFIPKNGMEVEIHINNIKKFGGILSVREAEVDGKERYRFFCDAQDFTRLLDKKLVNKTFETSTLAGQMVKTIISEFAIGAGIRIDKVQDGPAIDFASFRFNKVSDVIRAIASRVSFDWFVDVHRVLNFFPINDTFPPFPILEDEEGYRNLKVNQNTAQVRNRIIVDGGIIISPPFTQKWAGNGQSREFTIAYKAKEPSSVKVNGVSKTFGIDNVDADTDFDFIFNTDQRLLKNGANTATLSGAQTLEAIYTYEIPLVATVDDGVSQSQLASDEGSDGIYEAVISGEGLETVEAARDLGRAEAEKSAREILSGSFETREAGFEPGQQLTIHIPTAGIDNQLSTIRSVKSKSEGAGAIIYSVEFGARDEFEDFMADAFKRGKEAKFRRRGRKAEEGDEVKDQSVVSPEAINMLDFLTSKSEVGEPSGYEGQPSIFPKPKADAPDDEFGPPGAPGSMIDHFERTSVEPFWSATGSGIGSITNGEFGFISGFFTVSGTIERRSFSTDTQGAKGIEISLSARRDNDVDASASSVAIFYNALGGGVEAFQATLFGTAKKTLMVRHFFDGKVLRFIDGVEISRRDYASGKNTGVFQIRGTVKGVSPFLGTIFVDDVKVRTF